MAAIGVVTRLLPRASHTCAVGPTKIDQHKNRTVHFIALLGLEGMPLRGGEVSKQIELMIVQRRPY